MIILVFALIMAQQSTAEATVDWDKEFGVTAKTVDPKTGEVPVDPYTQNDHNAGAKPFTGPRIALAFGGQIGIRRIAGRMVDIARIDPRISAIFISQDMVRLKRTLYEQFCYLLNAGCSYSGRDMAAGHKGLGIRKGDLNVLVENLQQAMHENRVPFAAQNRLLSKLAPMSGAIISR